MDKLKKLLGFVKAATRVSLVTPQQNVSEQHTSTSTFAAGSTSPHHQSNRVANDPPLVSQQQRSQSPQQNRNEAFSGNNSISTSVSSQSSNHRDRSGSNESESTDGDKKPPAKKSRNDEPVKMNTHLVFPDEFTAEEDGKFVSSYVFVLAFSIHSFDCCFELYFQSSKTPKHTHLKACMLNSTM